MARLLLIVFAAALAIMLACMAGAAAFGPFNPNFNFDRDRWEDSEATAKAYPAGSVETRDFPWTATERLRLTGMVDVDYRQAPQAKITATGAPELLDQLRVDGEEIGMKSSSCVRFTFLNIETNIGDEDESESTNRSRRCMNLNEKQKMKITVTAPNVRQFEVSGASKLAITAYAQDTLDLDVSGAGSASGVGKARKLDLEVSGAGKADLSALVLEDARADISGASSATLAPTKSADLEVSGAGKAKLLTKPASVNSRVTGAGSVERP